MSCFGFKEVIWFLSNITAGTEQQIQAVIDAQLIPHVLHHLQYVKNREKESGSLSLISFSQSEIQIQEEAAWCISNLTSSGSSEQIEYVVHQHVLPSLWFVGKRFHSIRSICFCFFISHLLQQSDVSIVQVCLGAIDRILKQTSKEIFEKSKIEIEECGGKRRLKST